ncbi:hypothetical protein HPB51_005033 [Rhipicephalus microplus]|uniref:Uncharacterized protein n=1 Tax=Rhipicephalus microplus TaxID=6941 RepID=A0A9J6EF70_RHIMP|nr:hypothetical protein HPB51_005033 [Rhipicephalus microplus]
MYLVPQDPAHHQDSSDTAIKVGSQVFSTARPAEACGSGAGTCTCTAAATAAATNAAQQIGGSKEAPVDAPETPQFSNNMEVTVDGEEVSSDDLEENAGWRTVGSRKSNRGQALALRVETADGNYTEKQGEQCLRQLIKASRMPHLPRGDYKIIIRPRGGLRISAHGAIRIATSVYQAAATPKEAQDEDMVCPNL